MLFKIWRRVLLWNEKNLPKIDEEVEVDNKIGKVVRVDVLKQKYVVMLENGVEQEVEV